MTRHQPDEPGNDVLAAEIGNVLRQLKDEDDNDDDRSFRAEIRTKHEAMDSRLGRLESRQDAILLLIFAGVIGQLLLPLLRGS